jgi:hypothetical protein
MKRNYVRLLFAVLLCIVSGDALSQQSPAPIQGIVVEAGSNMPVAKATVELRAEGARTVVASTRTDREGRFFLTNINPGTYRLVTMHAGHVTETGTAFEFRAGQTLPNVRVALTAGGVISGRITDRGKPIGLADAVAVKAVWTEGQLTLRPIVAMRTDDTGEFHLFWLPPGRYYVIGVIWDIANSVGTFVNPDDGDGSNYFTQRFVGRAVFMRATGGGLLENEAHVPIYYPGTHDPQLARVIDVRPGSNIRGIDIDAAPLRTQRVTGQVLGVSPQARATVEMNLITASLTTSESLTPRVQADINGNFELKSVAPGRYMLTASTGDAIARTPVEVREAAVNNVVLSLGTRLSISGKVSVDGNVPQNVLSNMSVQIRQDPLRPNAATAGTALVRPDGTFTITGPPPSDFRVVVRPYLSPPMEDGGRPFALAPPLPNLYVKSIRLGDKEILTEKVHLEGRVQEPLTIVIGTNPGAVEGQASQGATVVLVHDNGLRYRVNERVTVADGAAHYEFKNVAPGNYKLFAWQSVEDGGWNDPEYMRAFESRGVPVRVEEGGRFTVNVPVVER